MNPDALQFLDWCILVEWSFVAGYFVRRFVLHRRLISLALAAMASGWALVGLGDLVGSAEGRLFVKCVALAFGIFLWFSIWRVEREKE